MSYNADKYDDWKTTPDNWDDRVQSADEKTREELHEPVAKVVGMLRDLEQDYDVIMARYMRDDGGYESGCFEGVARELEEWIG